MSSLYETYTNTRYFVLQENSFADLQNIYCCIHIDQNTPLVDVLMQQNRVEDASWAYITAWNPRSKKGHDNIKRNKELLQDIRKYIVRYGFGCSLSYDISQKTDSKKEDWLEESFLVLGISKEEAIALGTKYKQNAIVLGSYNTPALLQPCLDGWY